MSFAELAEWTVSIGIKLYLPCITVILYECCLWEGPNSDVKGSVCVLCVS